MKSKRVVVMSDLHCGHRFGLTPEQWQTTDEASNNEDIKSATIQRLLWSYYTEEIDALKPVDVLIVNGDAIDGKGERSGGTEQITADRRKQCEIAASCIERVNAKKTIMIYGTPYHTGKEEDWESVLADMVNAAKIGSHEWVDVNGCVLDCKHKVGASVIPHGRATAVLREALWNDLWSLKKSSQPLSDILIRSHVHYHIYVGVPNKLAMTTPAMQGYGSKFGARLCSGDVNIGFVHFDITSKEDYLWSSHILDTEYLAAQAFVV